MGTVIGMGKMLFEERQMEKKRRCHEVELLLLLTGALFVWLYFQRKKQTSNYKIDQDMLIVSDSMNQVKIPLAEIVEVTRVGKTAKQHFWLNLETISGKMDRVAVFTSSNISYLLKVRNSRVLIREVKERKTGVYTKAKVI
ncbi:hypothetical protein SD77_3798 [Bacillus badius]|uniref:Uncharacterized protein n=1 Tax=Bacillus badius TaxID=1455 RepID=A0ABR5AWA9_BACBA|nr:hypothetical protein SD77_3798 [Bacillus badius]